MKKIVIALVLVLALTVSTFAGTFADVPSNHWAYEAVNELVAAGLISGYPDGTFKGQNQLTRYEVATMLARLLEDIDEANDALAEFVDFRITDAILASESGLSSAQAEDAQAIFEAVLAKNGSVEVEYEQPDTLSVGQAGEVALMIADLAKEFNAELVDLGFRVDGLEDRVAVLEEAKPSVTFSGSYDVEFTDQLIDNEDNVVKDVDYYWINDIEEDYDGTDSVDPNASYVEIENNDPIVYSDPWDSDSDEIAADKAGGEISQTLNLQADIVKDGLNATVKFDAHEEDDVEDVLVLDAAELALENDSFAAVYNNANTANISDYAFDGSEFNGVTVNFKNYGVDVFAGIKGYGNDDVSTEDKEFALDFDGEDVIVERSVTKYELDDETGMLVPIKDEEDDFYVFGATKAFELADINLNTKYAGKAALNKNDDDEMVLDNWLGFDTATDLAGLDVNFDLGYYIPDAEDADSDMLVRFGAAKDLDIAGLEFNYKNRGENFVPISHEDNVVFDDGHDDYDKFTTGLAKADTTGWNFTVAPNLFTDMGLTTEFFYASVDEADEEETKLALSGEMPVLIDGLVANAEYAVQNKDDDDETKIKFGGEYEKDYLSANASYETVAEYGGTDKVVTAFGAAVADYPVLGALTASAGFDYEKEAEDHDKATTEYNLGLGYLLGAADLSYDFTNKTVKGDSADAEGVYTTNKVGLTYPIVEGTDFVASYEVLDLDLEDGEPGLNGAEDYTVKTATAGVSVSF